MGRKEERRIGKQCDLRTSFRGVIHRILHRRSVEPCRIAVRSFGLSVPSLFQKTDCTGQAKASAFPAAAVQYNTLHLHAGGVPLQGASGRRRRTLLPSVGGDSGGLPMAIRRFCTPRVSRGRSYMPQFSLRRSSFLASGVRSFPQRTQIKVSELAKGQLRQGLEKRAHRG